MKWRSVPSGFIVARPMPPSPLKKCSDRNRIFFPSGDHTGSDDPPPLRWLLVRLVSRSPSASIVKMSP